MTSAHDSKRSRTSFKHIAAVVALGVLVLASTLPNMTDAWRPSYSFGFSAKPDELVVNSLVPGGPADRAGVHIGDRVAPGLAYPDVLTVTYARSTSKNQVLDITFLRGNQHFKTHLIAQAGTISFYARVITPLKRLVSLVFITLGATLLLLRPTRMTWYFYLFALGSADATAFVYSSLSTTAYNILNSLVYAISGGGPAAFLGFCIRFPQDDVNKRRRLLDQLVPLLYVIGATLGALDWLSLTHAVPVSNSITVQTENIFNIVLFVIGWGCLLATYLQQPQQRQRIKWVIAGLIVGGASAAIASFLTPRFPNVNFSQTSFHPDFLYVLTMVIPLTVIYAIMRHRVIDVNFVISRAVAYGILTSLCVIVFALIDWFFVRKLVATNLGLIAEILVAIGLGFWLNSLHRRIDTLTDRIFFRRRYLAELQLARIARALPYATSQAAVDDFLVTDVAQALDLASAACFVEMEDGSFRLRKSLGWPDDAQKTLGPNDKLVLHLQSLREPLRVAEIRWSIHRMPTDAAYPSVALPINVRNELVAFTLYGVHQNNADLDPDEISMIDKLSVAAGTAYDHLEAAAMRQRIRNLEEEVRLAKSPMTETASTRHQAHP